MEINKLIKKYEDELVNISDARYSDNEAGDHTFNMEYDEGEKNIKQFIVELKKLISYTLYTLLVAVFCSCGTIVDPYSNYCESEIVEKEEAPIGKWFKFRHEGKITGRVYVMPIDWDNYEVGEPINCN